MKLLTSCLLATFLFFSCKKQDTTNGNNNNNNNNNTVQKGTITGSVVTPNNKTPVKNATVFIAEGGTIYSTFTDVNGSFALEAPAGQRVLNIQSGTGKIFRTTMNVTIEAQKSTAIAPAPVQLNQVAALAYVTGTFDKIQTILIDSLGYTATQIGSYDLANMSVLSQYNAIFINCSSGMVVPPMQDSTLAAYVANGGSLYVSDWAVCAIIGKEFNACPAPRPGGFIPDSKLCTRQIGTSHLANNAPIVSTSLQTYLNKTTMNVKYDLGYWEAVQNYDSAYWEVMVKHPITLQPILMRTANFTNGSAGTIPIGSTNLNMVTICHKPVGTTPVTITVPLASLSTHLGHGDSMGSCNSTNGAGRIYFTTFHNEPNGLISPDMKQILDYIILNL